MSYISVVNHNNEIHCWDRDENGELHHTVHPEPMYLFVRNKKGGEYKSIYGEPMEKREFDNRIEMQKYAKENKHRVAESDVQPVYRFLLDSYLEAPITPYNVSFFDIEVDFDLEDGHGYPSIQNPFGEINSISIYDCHLQCYIMIIPKHLKGEIEVKDKRDGIPVETFWCPNERDMLLTFADCLEHVDIISGWNSSSFDIPYIIERAILSFGEDDAARMYCRNNIPAKKREFVNQYGEETWEWHLAGRSHLDMMQLFKKFHPGEKKSFALDAICEEELGENKIQYDDDLGALYRENPQRFFDYSLHDSRLLKMLDDKQQIIALAMTMTWDMCALPKDVTGSVNILNMAIMKYARNRDNTVLPDMPETEKGEFEGALVFDTVPGRHENVFTVDISAMYPSSIIALGMSKENIVGQLKGEYDDYVAVMTKSTNNVTIHMEKEKEDIVLPACDLECVIRECGYCISPHGTLFDGTLGLLADFLEDAGKQRTAYKKLMKQSTDPIVISRYDMYQKVSKTKSNSAYGALSQPAFRLGDLRLSASTTSVGRLIGKYQAYKANEFAQGLAE